MKLQENLFLTLGLTLIFLLFLSSCEKQNLDKYYQGEHEGYTWGVDVDPKLDNTIWVIRYMRGAGSFDFAASHPNDTIKFYKYPDAEFISMNTGNVIPFSYSLLAVPNTYTKELRFAGFPLFSGMSIASSYVMWMDRERNFIESGILNQIRFIAQYSPPSGPDYIMLTMEKM